MQDSRQESINNNPEWPPVGWLTKSEAAKRLKLSESRVAAFAGRKIVVLPQKSPNSGQIVKLFHEGDVERIAYERAHPKELIRVPEKSHDQRAVVRVLSSLLTSPAVEDHPNEKPWLTVQQAAEFSGLPASVVLNLVKREELPALDCGPRPGGRWRVKRVDLEKLEGHR